MKTSQTFLLISIFLMIGGYVDELHKAVYIDDMLFGLAFALWAIYARLDEEGM